MDKEKNLYSEEEKHTAMPVIAGFAFQFYFFLYKLLTMEQGEVVSFEKLDDAATESKEAITFFQVKHTVKNAAALEGKGKLLTNRAPDLWKALDVWRKIVIMNGTEKRTKEEQIIYMNKHNFVLVSNKITTDNILVQLCADVRNGTATQKDVDDILCKISAEAIKRKADNEDISKTKALKKRNVQDMIDDLKAFELNSMFLKNIEFDLFSFDDIKQECLNHIIGTIRFPKEDALAVLNDFTMEVLNDFNECAKVGKPLEYQYEYQLIRFERVFSFHREKKLDFRVDPETFKQDFLDLVCIKQLMKVNDIKSDEFDKIAKYTSYFLSFKNHYLDLIDNNKILFEEDESFKLDAITYWNTEFDYVYDDVNEMTSEEDIIKMGKKLLHTVRSNKVNIRNEILINPISNGAYYYLSDECLIGWHHEWKTFFKDN